MMFLMATDKYNCSEKSLIENFALCSDHIILSRAFRNGYILNICNLIYTTRRSSFVELFLIFLPGLGFVSGNVSVRCPVGSRGFGVSLWSYLASEVTCGKVFCGYRPQNKAHLSEPGTHQRTWRVMGRPFHRLPQTLSMTRRNDSLCSPQDTSRVRIIHIP